MMGRLGLDRTRQGRMQSDVATRAPDAGHDLGQGVEHDDEPAAAGVHDPRQAEGLEHGGGQGQRVTGALGRGLHHGSGVRGAVLDPRRGRVGRRPRHGQDGALDGAGDRLVAEVGGPRQEAMHGGPVESVTVREAAEDLARTAQDLRQDHAGVAPSAHQGAGRHRPGRLIDPRGADRARPALVDRLAGGLHGQVEVGAGVAVGHREHVEGVDLHPCVPQAAEGPLGPVAHERRRHDCGHPPASSPLTDLPTVPSIWDSEGRSATLDPRGSTCRRSVP